MQKRFLAISFSSFLLLSFLAGAHSLNRQEVEINITDSGFSPNSIKISEGTTVIWINRGSNPHWPATDLHPTHNRYPGSGIEKCRSQESSQILDSCDGIKSNGSFLFHFDESGVWGIHDHLYPNLRMTVEVSASKENKATAATATYMNSVYRNLKIMALPVTIPLRIIVKYAQQQAKPQQADYEGLSENQAAAASKKFCYSGEYKNLSDKLPCYSKQFEEISQENGPEFAFRTLEELQTMDDNAKICHLIAHGIGWGAYERSPKAWKEHVATISPTCVYGALHGILERHIQDLPGKKLSKENIPELCESNPSPGCIHAVGHLLLVETENNIGNAINLCSEYPEEKMHRHYCITGVFMENMIGDNLVQHGIYNQTRRNKWYTYFDDFDRMCRSQSGENATACWEEIIHSSSIKFSGNPVKVFEHCNSAQSTKGARLCRRHAIGDLVIMSRNNLSRIKTMCSFKQKDDPTFEAECYSMMAGAVAFSSAPEYMDYVVDFCHSLDGKFRNSCFSSIGSTLKKRGISNQRIESLCKNAGNFTDYCLGLKGQIFAFEDKEIGLLENIARPNTKNPASEIVSACSEFSSGKSSLKEACYSEKFKEISFEQGPKRAFELLNYLQEIDKDALRCHFIAHGIGHGAYKRNPENAAEQIATISTICSFGAPMGIIEEYAASSVKGSLADNLHKICNSSSPTGCNHILGHMLMVENNADLNQSLTDCEAFNSSRPKLSQCLRGAFMENIEANNLIAHNIANESWLDTMSRKEELENLCSEFGGEKKIACFASLPKVLMVKHGSNAGAIFDSCELSNDSKAETECKIETVRLFEIHLNFNLNWTKRYCDIESNPEFLRQCYVAIAETKLNVLGDKGLDTLPFCASLGGNYTRHCFDRVRWELREIYNEDFGKIDKLCKSLHPRFFSQCFGSSGNSTMMTKKQ